MAFPKALATRFLQLVSNRQFTEAQRELQRIKLDMSRTKWNLGYYRALLGMLLTRKTSEGQYAFLANVNLKDKISLEKNKEEFLRQIQNRFHDDFDRGFFSAWHDYMRLLIKTLGETQPEADDAGQTSIIHYAKPVMKPQ